MQGDPPHTRWSLSETHKEWQKAVASGNIEQAQLLWSAGIVYAPQVKPLPRKFYNRAARRLRQAASLPQLITAKARGLR
jgi:hypothetical protein